MRRSHLTEIQVKKFLSNLGWSFLYHDVYLLNVQIDLILRDPSGLLQIVEVKSETAAGSARVSFKQKKRLLAVCSLLAQWEPVDVRLALVHRGANIVLLPLC